MQREDTSNGMDITDLAVFWQAFTFVVPPSLVKLL